MKGKALQHPQEFAEFVNILVRENVRSYLEIGSKFGGSLWLVASALPRGSLIVSVDLPGPVGSSDALRHIAHRIRKQLGMRVELILGDSHDASTVSRVRSLSPFDAVFIDGDHSMAGVEKDWCDYGHMAKVVAFHDISWKRVTGGDRIEVPKLWALIKDKYRHHEIRMDRKNNGIGILWTGE